MLEPRVLLAGLPLDSTFGTGGMVIWGVPNQIDLGRSITLQPDAKIVVGGWNQVPASRHANLTRLLPNGAFDPSFGTGGSSELPDVQDPYAVTIASTGEIISGGTGHNGFQITGTLSSTSGAGVHQWTQVFTVSSKDTFYDVKVQNSGRIIATGEADGGSAFLFAALQPNGSFDPSYKGGGRFFEDLDSSAVGNVAGGFAIVPRADGGYLAAGLGWNGSSSSFVTVRHLANGQRDESYGVHGVTGPVGPGPVGQVGDVKVLGDGSFFVSSAYNILAKFTPQGEIDPIFGVRDIPGGQRQEIRPLANGNVAVVTFADPVKVTLFDQFGNLLSESQSAPLTPGHWAEVDDGIIQDDGKVVVTGRWSPTLPFSPGDQWQLTTEEYVARTQSFGVLAVPEPSTVFVGVMVAINLLARRSKKQAHHQRGRSDLRRSRR
ncbi:MAG TPA: delta-60 repeat domain-containing protein [Tepidisphaeraceae bacterium]|nr:delta-60 repeat domain-containing protein [Tepidisphaeraceae bacterium]